VIPPDPDCGRGDPLLHLPLPRSAVHGGASVLGPPAWPKKASYVAGSTSETDIAVLHRHVHRRKIVATSRGTAT